MNAIIQGLVEFLHSIACVDRIADIIVYNDDWTLRRQTHQIVVIRKFSHVAVRLFLRSDLSVVACLGYMPYWALQDPHQIRKSRHIIIDLTSPQSMDELRQFVSID